MQAIDAVLCERGRYVDMSDCNLNGTLPASLSTLTNLNTLSLSGNAFSGSIPNQWTQLLQLQRLAISHPTVHGLTGTIPVGIGAMSSLMCVATHAPTLPRCL